MTAECTQVGFEFHSLNHRQIRAQFDGGAISSDGGGLLLREVDKRTGIIRKFAACFTDYRDPERIEHRLEELVAQRVYGLALGYEDLNDHDQLRNDPLLAVLVEKSDPSQEVLAGKSTLNRLELTPATATAEARYKKIVLDHGAVDRLLVDLFLEAHGEAPQQIILDLDATDDPLYGKQEGRFFHGYYGHYCYRPLYIFCGQFLLCARLRPSNIDGAAGSVAELQRIVPQIRSVWPQVRIIIRGDSGFCREELMAWCETEQVDYLLGLAKNERLKAEIQNPMAKAEALYRQSGQAARVFHEFVYQTRESWSRARRVVAKAEYLEKGENPRFIVTSLDPEPWPAQTTDVVFGSHQHGLSAQQSAASVFLLAGLRPAPELAPTGAGGNGVGPGPVRHPPAEVAQDRCPDPHHRAQGMGLARRGIPLCRIIPADSCQALCHTA
jgi:hypothetical protein